MVTQIDERLIFLLCFSRWFLARCPSWRRRSWSRRRRERTRPGREWRSACWACAPRQWTRPRIWSVPWRPGRTRSSPSERRGERPGRSPSASRWCAWASSDCTFAVCLLYSWCYLATRPTWLSWLWPCSCKGDSSVWFVDILKWERAFLFTFQQKLKKK